MKFKNISVGDEVLVYSTVRVGWSGGIGFWVPALVERVTPQRFEACNKTYKKDDGRCFGGSSFSEPAKLISEHRNQISEKNYLIKRLNAEYKIKEKVEGVIVSYDHKNLFKILDKLYEVEKLINMK